MRRTALAAFLVLCAGPLLADPAPPVLGPAVADLQVGVFCASQAMEQHPAPGTLSGWIHVPANEIAFQWPDRQVVPASLGLAFGVKARLASGVEVPQADMRVYRPGLTIPDRWTTSFGDLTRTSAFFRFDRPEELIPGLWRVEAWDGPTQIYAVDFQVVPADALPGIVAACGTLS